MSEAVSNTAKPLTRLLEGVVEAIAEAIRPLGNHPLTLAPGGFTQARIPENDSQSVAYVRFTLGRRRTDPEVGIVMEVPDASSLAATMLMATDEDMDQSRRAVRLEGERLQAFGDAGIVIGQGLEEFLKQAHVLEACPVRRSDFGTIDADLDPRSILESPSLTFSFTLQIAGYPASRGYVLLDKQTAERWNGGPLRVGDGATEEPRGRVATYVADPMLLGVVRQSCQHLNLELTRHAKGEVPNPAAHRGDIVLIEVQAGDDRQFEWCLRLKQYDPDIKVMLVVQYPSKPRVVRAVKVAPDAILGHPLSEADLCRKLESLLAPVP